MTETWSFFSPTRIVSGDWKLCISQLPVEGSTLLVTTPGFSRRGLTEEWKTQISNQEITVLDKVTPNPDIDQLDAWINQYRSFNISNLIALGGGSAIDSAKVLSLFLPSSCDISVSSHFRDQLPLSDTQALPILAVPTTSGTGAEVTPFATVWDFANSRKYSLASDKIAPSVALLDPLLTQGSPREVTISSGLDAISHAFESIWNHNANVLTMTYATKSLSLGLNALSTLADDLNNIEARRDMQLSSNFSGLAISSTRTALAHSISYPLTARYNLPHGLACSFTLPALLRFNHIDDDGRLSRLAIDLGFADVLELSNHLVSIMRAFGIKDLLSRYLPTTIQDIYDLKSKMISPGRADNNLRTVNENDVEFLLRQSFSTLFS